MMVFQHKETMFSVSYKTVSSRNNCSFYRAHTHEHVYKHPEVKSILFRNNISYHKGKSMFHYLPLIFSIAGSMASLHNSLPFLLWKHNATQDHSTVKLYFLKLFMKCQNFKT